MSLTATLVQFYKKIDSHPAISQLEKLKKTLIFKQPTQEKMKIIFSSLWPFYRETPSGILTLAVKIADFWQKIDPSLANEKAKLLLKVAFDEYGSEENSSTHHYLFFQTARSFNISMTDILSERYRVRGSEEMAKLAHEYYRNGTIARGIGFHYASEATSEVEFKSLFEGLSAHPYLNVGHEKERSLFFFKIHTLIEPQHVTSAKQLIHDILIFNSDFLEEVYQGAFLYLKSYEYLFFNLNENLIS